MNTSTIIKEILSFPVEKRAELVEILLQSMNPDIDPSVEKMWIREAENRLKAYRTGKINSTDVHEVSARLRKKHS